MKTENTIENKAKFFALYWGQEVLYVPNLIYSGNPPQPSHEEWGEAIVNEHWLPKVINSSLPLFLKPLSKISDEEALILSEIRYSFEEYINIENGKCMVSCHENQKYLMQIQVDYLRSKGYALPYIDLSVEDLQNYGWIKLEK